jgi:hypothetical protein
LSFSSSAVAIGEKVGKKRNCSWLDPGPSSLQLLVVIENRLQKTAFLFRLRVIRNKPSAAAMTFRFLPADSLAAVRMPVGQTVLLNPALLPSGSCIEVLDGVARVYCPCEETVANRTPRIDQRKRECDTLAAFPEKWTGGEPCAPAAFHKSSIGSAKL